MAEGGTAASGPKIAWDLIDDAIYQRIKNGWGTDGEYYESTPTTPLPVFATSRTVKVEANFTRPTETGAYAIAQLVANSAAVGSVVPLTFTNALRLMNGRRSGFVRGAKLLKSTSGVTNASFRLHLFNATPDLITTGDKGTMSTILSSAGHLGSLDITVDQNFRNGAVGYGMPRGRAEIALDEAGTTLYGLLEARQAYSPGNAEVFTVTLEIQQD